MFKQLFGLAVLMLLASCSGDSAAPTAPAETPPTSATTDAVEAAPAIASANSADRAPIEPLPPGAYCYTLDDAMLTGAVRLTVDAAAQVSGDSSVAIHNEAAGYYSSYAQNFAGKLVSDRAELATTTWIEYDRQTAEETWQVTPETLTINDDVFTAADCDSEAVRVYFVGPDGLDRADLLTGLPAGQPVTFEPGTSGTTLENSVVRGDRDVYRLGAEGGQLMTLDISAIEDNAVFDVISPSGYVLARESLSESLVLPQTGDYHVIVGGTRGNATYSLTVTIE